MPGFYPPEEQTRVEHGELWWAKLSHGVTVYRIGGVWYSQRFPSQTDLDSADRVYVGGHEYQISNAEAADLTAAGFGSYIY